MRRKDNKPALLAENSYQKRQRRRAERVIQATGVFSAEFRAIVHYAMDNDRKQLRRLLAEADAYVQKHKAAAKEQHKRIQRNAGCLPELLADRDEYILQRGFELARLLEDSSVDGTRWDALTSALVELSSATSVYYFHPQVVEAFFRQAVITAIEKGKDGAPDTDTQRVLNEIQVLLNTSTPQRIVEEIARRYNGESAKPSTEYLSLVEPSGATKTDTPARENSELAKLRRNLETLELLPENEAIRFQLESQVYKLERETENAERWPDVIGDEGGNDHAVS
jgi:hypothetical protein